MRTILHVPRGKPFKSLNSVHSYRWPFVGLSAKSDTRSFYQISREILRFHTKTQHENVEELGSLQSLVVSTQFNIEFGIELLQKLATSNSVQSVYKIKEHMQR